MNDSMCNNIFISSEGFDKRKKLCVEIKRWSNLNNVETTKKALRELRLLKVRYNINY